MEAGAVCPLPRSSLPGGIFQIGVYALRTPALGSPSTALQLTRTFPKKELLLSPGAPVLWIAAQGHVQINWPWRPAGLLFAIP